MKRLILALFVLTVSSCQTSVKDPLKTSQETDRTFMKTIIESKEAPAPIGPYSQAVLHNNTLYVSGQIAINPLNGQLDTSNITNETKLVLKNLDAVLSEAGMDFSNVLKCSIFLSDMSSFSEVNNVYAAYFKNDPPARETVAVKTLPKNVNVEISCIASK